jgi:hypothetical protein
MPFKSADAVPILITAASTAMLAAAILTTSMHADPVGAPQIAKLTNDSHTSQGIPLDRVGNPKHELAAATVQTAQGEKIGRVQSIEVDAHGKPAEVKIAANGLFGFGTLTRVIAARDLSYIKSRKTLVSESPEASR